MFVKRTAQRKLLEDQYAGAGNNLIILYGRKGMGKTSLLTEFLEGKPNSYYYDGIECEDSLQLCLMKQSKVLSTTDTEHLTYFHLLSEFVGRQKEKAIIVLDEFHYILKNAPEFADTLHLLAASEKPVMLVLCSSSIRWVENEMISFLGPTASYITGYLKLKELTFVDFVHRFSKSSVETCIHIKAILGGVPEYLDEWQEDQSVQNNICSILLNKNSRLFSEPQQYLKLELRETAVYNTILSALAAGNRKLNDLHWKTGYSRAKISVYLKNLIELDVVEKLIPLGDEGKENVQKGLYRIKDNFLNFWYRFVFPNRSELMLGQIENVYEEKISPNLNEYLKEYFADVCTEFLKLMNLHHRLEENFIWWDRWYGKQGTIDILAQGENKKNLIGLCLWTEEEADRKDLDVLIKLANDAKITPDYCYLFSKGGFTVELRQLAKEKNTVKLIGLEDL